MAFHNNSKIFIPLEPLQKPYIKSYDLNAILMANNDLPLVANQCEEIPLLDTELLRSLIQAQHWRILVIFVLKK